MDDKPKPLSVSTGHARILLDVGITKLKDLVSEGKLSAVMKDKRIHITMASIESYHASLPAYIPGSTLDLHAINPVKRKTKRARRAVAR
jgi:hypothetical protein